MLSGVHVIRVLNSQVYCGPLSFQPAVKVILLSMSKCQLVGYSVLTGFKYFWIDYQCGLVHYTPDDAY